VLRPWKRRPLLSETHENFLNTFFPKPPSRKDIYEYKLRYLYVRMVYIRYHNHCQVGWARSTHGRREIRTKLFSENLEIRDHSEDLGVDGKMLLEWILGKYGG
jgi:hypothetical protein